MASPNIYQSGLNLAGTVFQNGPATLQLDGPTYLSGLVQWVDTIDGDNANAGDLPELPVATLAQAITNFAAAPNGVIVIGEGSSEILTVSQTIGLAGISIFGCGTGSSRPRYTCDDVIEMWATTVLGVWIEGFYFPASTAAAASRVSLAGNRGMIKDCYFECGANDTGSALLIGGSYCEVEGCSFVTTAERPAHGISATSAITDTTIRGCTFDGGSYGWSDYAVEFSGATARARLIENTFSNRSDIGFTTTGTSYQLIGNEMDGTSNVRLDA